MPAYFQGKKVSRMGALTEPSTYDADLTPVDMQRGKTAYVKGKKITGTGKCFEYASYGRKKIDLIIDENGNDKYGFVVEGGGKSNLIFLSTASDGDSIFQEEYLIGELEEGKAFKVGGNTTTNGDIVVFSFEGLMLVYFSNTPNLNMRIAYFAGKDNKI